MNGEAKGPVTPQESRARRQFVQQFNHIVKRVPAMAKTISRDEVLRRLHYNEATGEFTWAGTFGVRAISGRPAGSIEDDGYVRIRVIGKSYLAHRLAWLIKTGAWPLAEVDHKNGKPADNRWENLRQATPAQNRRNRTVGRNNTSGFKGVSFHKPHRKWQAQIAGKSIGYFQTPQQASDAYQRAAGAMFGEFQRAS